MSNRKPYVREMKRTWWSNHPFYRFYMLREATVLPLILFTVFLTFGLGSLVKGPEAWAGWLKHQTMLVNENRLSLVDPQARKYLTEQTEAYFFGDGADEASGYVPTKQVI